MIEKFEQVLLLLPFLLVAILPFVILGASLLSKATSYKGYEPPNRPRRTRLKIVQGGRTARGDVKDEKDR